MARVHYSVLATLPDQPTTTNYLRWLSDGHIQAVLAAGAASALILQHLEPPNTIETRYVFDSIEDLHRYERTAAPTLRAEGIRLFGSREGVSFSRTRANVVQLLDAERYRP
ncbi:MAG: DUF4286 family protein [Phycisphaeraceae bacterium]|nr:DUF4286 family protein [Phycisphaeraceae bacterium]